MTAISPPGEGALIRAGMVCAGDTIRLDTGRAATVAVPDLIHDVVGIPYTECRSGKRGVFSLRADLPVTLLRSAGTRAA